MKNLLQVFLLLVLLCSASKAPAATVAYATGGPGLTMIDTQTASVFTGVPLLETVGSIAVHPSGQTVYVTQFHIHTVAVVDVSSRTVIATIPISRAQAPFSLNPAGTRLYVGSEITHLGEAPEDFIKIIDTATNTEVATVSLGRGVYPPQKLFFDPGGTRAYFQDTRTGEPRVSYIDTVTNMIVSFFTFDSASTGLHMQSLEAIHPSGNFLYLTAGPISGTPKVVVIDTRSATVVSTIEFGDYVPFTVAPHGNGALVYAVTVDRKNIRVTDSTTGNDLAVISLGITESETGVISIVVSPATGFGYALVGENAPCGIGPPGPPPPCIRHMRYVAALDPSNFTVRSTLNAGTGDVIGKFLLPTSGNVVYLAGPHSFSAFEADRVVVTAPLLYQADAIGPNTNTAEGPLRFYQLTNRGIPSSVQWGSPGDQPVPADYDRDGKADIAVWRRRDSGEEGVWYIQRSGDGGVTRQQFGAAQLADQPVAADYDGDGRADIAVYRPPSSTTPAMWYVFRSLDGAVIQQQFGTFGDVPVPGDYDGDGRADFAVWRPGSGTWYIMNSRDGSQTGRQWGVWSDVPVPADYDGDGRTDIAVWRPQTGEWLIIYSSTGQVATIQFGSPGDAPVPQDYDGDHRADLAVWRPQTGEWFILNSGDGSITQRQWGARGDLPIPNDYEGFGRADLTVYRP